MMCGSPVSVAEAEKKARCLRATGSSSLADTIFIDHSGWVIWPSAHSSFARFTGLGRAAWFTIQPPPSTAAPTPPLSLPPETSRHTILSSACCLASPRPLLPTLHSSVSLKYASRAFSAPLTSTVFVERGSNLSLTLPGCCCLVCHVDLVLTEQN